eukprot:873148-Lingulodinium_polyedra.AAC.1
MQARVSDIAGRGAFVGMEQLNPDNMGAGFANRHPFKERDCAKGFGRQTRVTAAPSTSGL